MERGKNCFPETPAMHHPSLVDGTFASGLLPPPQNSFPPLEIRLAPGPASSRCLRLSCLTSRPALSVVGPESWAARVVKLRRGFWLTG